VCQPLCCVCREFDDMTRYIPGRLVVQSYVVLGCCGVVAVEAWLQLLPPAPPLPGQVQAAGQVRAAIMLLSCLFVCDRAAEGMAVVLEADGIFMAAGCSGNVSQLLTQQCLRPVAYARVLTPSC
jgi:hypothetical protein